MLALPLLPFLPPGLSPLPFPAPLPWLLLLLALLALAAAAYLPFKSLASSLLAPHRAAVLPTSTPANGHTTALFPPPPLRGRGRGRTKPLGRFASLGLGLGFGRRAKSLGPVLPRFALPLDEQRSVHGHGHPYAHPYVPSAPPTPSPRLPEFAGAVPLVDLSDSHSHLHYAERGAEGLAGAVERDSWGTLSSLSSGSAPTSTRPSVSERGNRHAQLVDVSPSSEEADLVDVSVPPSPAAWARAHPISPRAMAFPEPMRPVPASPNVNPLPALPLPPALNAPLLLPRADINTTEAMNTHTPALAPAAAAVFATVAEPAHEYGYEEEMQMQEQTQTQLPSPPLSPPPLFSASASTSASASASASTSAAPRKDGYAAEAEVEASTRAFGGAVVHPASDSDSESDSDHEVEAAPPAPAPAYPLPVSGPTRLVVSPPPPTGEAQEGDEEQVEEQAEENTVGDEEEDEEELPSPRAIDAVVRGMHVAPPGYVSDADADAGSGADDDGEREEGDGAPAYAYAVEDGSVEAQDGGAEVEAPMEVEVERGVEAVATGGEGVLLAPVAALADDHVHAYEDVDVDAHAGDGDAERGYARRPRASAGIRTGRGRVRPHLVGRAPFSLSSFFAPPTRRRIRVAPHRGRRI
ncbi:hypothetical protein B0H11DRAFT_45593 [Mycena galericulata]|nr:hypothetical protein B0H11DRAFT_45593 [Mycena galericulata]